jgi:cytochrome c-type biogenesis protein CcmE
MKPKHQRLALALLAVLAIIGAGLLASFAMRDQASYFFTPSEARAADISDGQVARLGGMVERGSVTHAADGVTIHFRLTDGKASVPVSFRGITPDLFGEGQGAVADGHFTADGSFVADRILAKHDERYMPPQMGEMPTHIDDTVVNADAAGSSNQ